MKQSAPQASPVALLPSGDPPKETAATLSDFFDGWLNSVAPAVLQSKTLHGKQNHRHNGRRPLTIADVVRVARSTVRESTDHRHWPPDVVESFLVADVITRTRR